MGIASLSDEVEIAQAVLGDDAKAVEAAKAVANGTLLSSSEDADVAAYLATVAAEGPEDVEKKFSFGGKEPGTFDQCVIFQRDTRGYGEARAKRICGAIQSRQESKKTKTGSEAPSAALKSTEKDPSVLTIDGDVSVGAGGTTSPTATLNVGKNMPSDLGTDDAAGPYVLKVCGATTHEYEGAPTYSYDLAVASGEHDVRVGGVRSNQKFAVGDLVEVTGSEPQLSVWFHHLMVMGPSKGPVATLQSLMSVEKSASVEVGAVVEKRSPFTRFVPFAKRTITDAKHEIGGVIYPADKLDAHKEYAKAEDLREAAHQWLAHSPTFNVEHTDIDLPGVRPAESYIAKTAIPEWEAETNDWVGVAKVGDDATWADIENGVYKGFSIQGVSDKVQEVGKRRMTKILVTRISLVREPATMMEFMAKNTGAMPREETMSTTTSTESPKVSLDPVKAGLDRLQGTATEMVDALGCRRPETLALFKAYDSPEAQRVSLMADQADYIDKLLKTAYGAIKEHEETLAKAMAVAKSQKEIIDAFQDKVAAYETHPEIAEVARKLEGATA